jgi:hypothetical protein
MTLSTSAKRRALREERRFAALARTLTDAARIRELEAEVAALRAAACPVHAVALVCPACEQARRGATRSAAKADAARANGARGGRPRRAPAGTQCDAMTAGLLARCTRPARLTFKGPPAVGPLNLCTRHAAARDGITPRPELLEGAGLATAVGVASVGVASSSPRPRRGGAA